MWSPIQIFTPFVFVTMVELSNKHAVREDERRTPLLIWLKKRKPLFSSFLVDNIKLFSLKNKRERIQIDSASIESNSVIL